MIRDMTAARTTRWLIVGASAAAAVALAIWSGWQDRSPAPPPRRTDDSRVECAARLARIGKALCVYATDHDGRYPVADTPGDTEARLLPLLRDHGVRRQDLRCPARPEFAYTYHCYSARGTHDWPRWMLDEHIVTADSPPGAWLLSDHVMRDQPGPHSPTEKAFNYLCADGRVAFHVGRPREIYE